MLSGAEITSEARAQADRLLEAGILAKDTHGQTVRLAPPIVIDEDEIVVLGGVRVTSPLRTACDLVRSATQFDAALQLVVLQLLGLAGEPG